MLLYSTPNMVVHNEHCSGHVKQKYSRDTMIDGTVQLGIIKECTGNLGKVLQYVRIAQNEI